jgi:DNA polymerase I-like protein with 3'-5' exonuclease and polymerase domains
VAFRQNMNTQKLHKLWEDKSVIKSAHGAKFDVGMTEKFIKRHITAEEFHCTYLMAHVLRNNHYSNGLDDLCWELCGYPKKDDRAIKPYISGGGNYKYVPEHLMTKYQIADGQRGEILTSLFLPKIYGNADFAEIYESERALVPVTLRMEERGVLLNRDRCYWLYAKQERDREAVLDEIQSITGERAEPKGDK